MIIVLLVVAIVFALLAIIVDLTWWKSRGNSRFYSIMSKISTLIGSVLCLFVIQRSEQADMALQMYSGILLLFLLLFFWPIVKFFLGKNSQAKNNW